MIVDREKILKLLNLTKSPNDNEALLAIRMANKMIEKCNSDWMGFLKIEIVKNTGTEWKPRPQRETYRDTNYQYKSDNLDEMFEQLRNAFLPKNTLEFINSVFEQYSSRGRISIKQYYSLVRLWEVLNHD